MKRFFLILTILLTLLMQGFVNAQETPDELTTLQKVRQMILELVPDAAGLENTNSKVDSLNHVLDSLKLIVDGIGSATSSGNPDSLNNLPGSAYMLKNDSTIFASRFYTDQQLLTKAASNHNHSGVYEPIISKEIGYLRWNGISWGFINETYSLSSHNHSGVYEPVKGADDNYVTDAEKIVIGNTSGTNTGDNATNSQYSGLAASKLDQYDTPTVVPDGIITLYWDKIIIPDPSDETKVVKATAVDLPISNLMQTALNAKQNTLVSGTNIKTVNNQSLLGSGNITITGFDSVAVVETAQALIDTTGNQLSFTAAEVDSLLLLAGQVPALQDSIASFRTILNSILTALDTCGCGANISDNTPPLPPSSYTAIGGTSQTQYVTTWTDPTALDLDSLRWYEGSSNDTTTWNWIASIAAGVQTYTRTGRSAGTTYWSGVKAIDDSGNVSWFSNIDSATTQSGSAPSYTAGVDYAWEHHSLTNNTAFYEWFDSTANNLRLYGSNSDAIYMPIERDSGVVWRGYDNYLRQVASFPAGLFDGALTIEMVVKVIRTDSSQCFFQARNSSNIAMGIGIGATGIFVGNAYDATNAEDYTHNSAATTGWHHLVYVWNGTTTTAFYVDGAAATDIGDLNQYDMISGDNRLSMGKTSATNFPICTGTIIPYVAIYKEALNSTQVSNNYNSDFIQNLIPAWAR